MLDDVRCFHVLRRHLQRGYAINELTLDAQHLSAGCKHCRVWAHVYQRFRHTRRGVDDVLTVVENQEEFLITDRSSDRRRRRPVAA